MGLVETIIAELEIGADLGDEFRRQSGLYAGYGARQARAEDMVRQAEEALELVFADLYSAYKKKHPDAKENDAKSFIRRNKDHKAAVAAVNKAKLQRDLLKVGCKAFEMRRDMLMQLGASERVGWSNTDLSVKKVATATDVLKRTARKSLKRRPR